MTKVSKNLKKLRTAKNLTQDALAQKLFVTRQTVSSWENDRTQPDIDMLCKISEALEVSVEDIIYGEKRFSTPEEKLKSRKRTLIIVFSVIASVLTGTGLVLIFVNGWEMLPFALKGIFAFVPILAGQGAAVFTYIKKYQSVAWREGVSVIWCAGIAATVALVNSVFQTDGGFANCMLLDVIMFLPVIYILDAAAPLAFYYAGAVWYGFYMLDRGRIFLPAAAMLVLFFLGLGYVIKNRKKKDDVRHIYTLWISVIALYFIVLILSAFLSDSYTVALTASTAFFLCLHVINSNDTWTMPFMPISVFGLAVTSVLSTYFYLDGTYGILYAENIIMCIILVIAVALSAVIGRKSFKGNVNKIIYCSFSAVNLILPIISKFLPSNDVADMLFFALLSISALGMALSLIAYSATSGRFVPLNLGLISAAAIVAYMTVMLIDINILTAGIMLVLFGIVLFTVNFLLSKKMKKEVNDNAQ